MSKQKEISKSMSKKLQKEKLRLEIENLKKKWYKKSDFLKVLLPTTLAIFSLIYALTSGFFSTKSELLELKKEQLQSEITEFEKDKTKLLITNKNLLAKRSQLYDSIKLLSDKSNNYENRFRDELNKKKTLLNEIEVLKNTKIDYSDDLAELEKEYQNKRKKYLKEIENNYFQEVDFEKEIKVLKDSINVLNNDVDRLQYYSDMLMNSPYARKFKHQQWGREKMIEYLNAQQDELKMTLKEIQKVIERSEKVTDTMQVKQRLWKMN